VVAELMTVNWLDEEKGKLKRMTPDAMLHNVAPMDLLVMKGALAARRKAAAYLLLAYKLGE
jgi:hypothetical protein